MACELIFVILKDSRKDAIAKVDTRPMAVTMSRVLRLIGPMQGTN
jgi:hypothetical protein